MMKSASYPRARTDRLVIKELPDEMLVYDLERDKAHCLNSTAILVWKACDGSTTPQQIAAQLLKASTVSGSPTTATQESELLVWNALDQLSRNHLLEENFSWPAILPHVSRRDALRRVAIGAVIALPLVASMTAPIPAQAGTCKPRNASCSTGAECCSTACVTGHCA